MDCFWIKKFLDLIFLTTTTTTITTTTTKTLMGFDTIEINLVFLIFTFQSISCIPIFLALKIISLVPKDYIFFFFFIPLTLLTTFNKSDFGCQNKWKIDILSRFFDILGIMHLMYAYIHESCEIKFLLNNVQVGLVCLCFTRQKRLIFAVVWNKTWPSHDKVPPWFELG